MYPSTEYPPTSYGKLPTAPPLIQYATGVPPQAMPLYGQPPMAPPPIQHATGVPPQALPSYGQPPMEPPPIQYATGVPSHVMNSNGEWSTGLCECGSDVSNCCTTCWCPCITFGQIAEISDKGTTSCTVHGALYTILLLLTGCQWIYSCMYRSKMRQQYMLPEEPCNDCLVHCCCEACAMCQEYRELQHRGFNMSLGWHGNMERQNHGVVMPQFAPVQMKR